MTMRKSVAVAFAVLLGACVQLPPHNPPAQVQVARAWLVGGWIPQGKSCESDAGVRYDEDGMWVAYKAAGTWELLGSDLISLINKKQIDGVEVLLSAPERRVERLQVLGPDTFQSRWFDGTVVTLRRCGEWRG